MSFDKRWDSKKVNSTSVKENDTIKSSDPLKLRLNASIRRIELENQRLEQASIRFQARDKEMFNKIVEAYTKHDATSANVYANELAEIRKMARMILQAKLALEQIMLRMKTVTELGDVAVTLLPVVGIVKEVKSGLSSINPMAERQFSDIRNVLDGIVVDANMLTGIEINFDSLSEDSSKILVDAQKRVEEKMNETFPDLRDAESDRLAT